MHAVSYRGPVNLGDGREWYEYHILSTQYGWVYWDDLMEVWTVRTLSGVETVRASVPPGDTSQCYAPAYGMTWAEVYEQHEACQECGVLIPLGSGPTCDGCDADLDSLVHDGPAGEAEELLAFSWSSALVEAIAANRLRPLEEMTAPATGDQLALPGTLGEMVATPVSEAPALEVDGVKVLVVGLCVLGGAWAILSAILGG